jgi:hypothetical protein
MSILRNSLETCDFLLVIPLQLTQMADFSSLHPPSQPIQMSSSFQRESNKKPRAHATLARVRRSREEKYEKILQRQQLGDVFLAIAVN